MKKIIVGVFAHPDDESFGPAGTLVLEAQKGTEIHLITLTAGESGNNPDNHENLGAVRLKEWRTAGKLIGAHSMTHLGYHDNALNNTSMVEIAEKVEAYIRRVVDEKGPDELELMSFELGGLTGHIDHIVAARATCLVYYRLKKSLPCMSCIRLFALPESWVTCPDTQWVFMDKGVAEAELQTIDVSSVRERCTEIIKAHHTQRSDAQQHLRRHRTFCRDKLYNHFIVRH